MTGANGFVGYHLCSTLAESGYDVIGATRSDVNGPTSTKIKLRACGDIGTETDWRPVLQDVDYVVHLAARVHVMRDEESDPLAAFRRTNVYGTERLLRSVGESGVKRKLVTRSFGKGDHVVVIDGIPLLACPHCGESYFTADTLQEVERLRMHRASLPAQSMAPVLSYV